MRGDSSLLQINGSREERRAKGQFKGSLMTHFAAWALCWFSFAAEAQQHRADLFQGWIESARNERASLSPLRNASLGLGHGCGSADGGPGCVTLEAHLDFSTLNVFSHMNPSLPAAILRSLDQPWAIFVSYNEAKLATSLQPPKKVTAGFIWELDYEAEMAVRCIFSQLLPGATTYTRWNRGLFGEVIENNVTHWRALFRLHVEFAISNDGMPNLPGCPVERTLVPTMRDDHHGSHFFYINPSFFSGHITARWGSGDALEEIVEFTLFNPLQRLNFDVEHGEHEVELGNELGKQTVDVVDLKTNLGISLKSRVNNECSNSEGVPHMAQHEALRPVERLVEFISFQVHTAITYLQYVVQRIHWKIEVESFESQKHFLSKVGSVARAMFQVIFSLLAGTQAGLSTSIHRASYPFLEAGYLPYREAFRSAARQRKLVHCIVIWGRLDDQSC